MLPYMTMLFPVRPTAVVLLSLLPMPGIALERSTEAPNIVLIISDDQAWTDYGFMGHETIRTPRIDTLASESATFRRGYVPTALCRPSLMTLATGLYAHQHRTTGNDPARTPANARHAEESGQPARERLIAHVDRVPTLPRLLDSLGYLSFQSGKWWEGGYRRGGFTHGMTRGYPEKGGRHGDDGLKIGREGLAPVYDFIDLAIEQEKPFFLWYAPFLPHTPHDPPERLLEKYRAAERPAAVARYYAMCEWFDETCGELLDRLDKKGLREITLVVYVTDNGWIQHPRGGYGPQSKRSPYEGGVRTPILFRWPGVIGPSERPELCSSIDIVPTILAAAGAVVPAELPGLDLLPAIRDGEAIERTILFGEAFAHDIADIERPEASLLHRWAIEGDWKLVLTYDGRRGEMKYPPTDFAPLLFDLKSDSEERVDLAAEEAGRVQRLTERIDGWWPAAPRRHGVAPAEGDRDRRERSPR